MSIFEISFEDLEKEVELNGKLGLGKAKISQVIEYLNFIYANKVGCEFEYIRNREQKEWLARETENALLNDISKEEKIKILKQIN